MQTNCRYGALACLCDVHDGTNHWCSGEVNDLLMSQVEFHPHSNHSMTNRWSVGTSSYFSKAWFCFILL